MTHSMLSETARRQVTFDATSGTLTVGGRATIVTGDLGDNERLLRTYLGLVAEQRAVPIGRAVHLRRADIATLASLLDLDHVDLADDLARILQLTADEATDLHRRLLRQRLAVAAMGVGLIAAVPAGASAAEAPAPAVATAPATSKAIVTPFAAPVTVTAAAVGVDDTDPEIELAPAVRHERPEPTATPEPGVDIGDALTIER